MRKKGLRNTIILVAIIFILVAAKSNTIINTKTGKILEKQDVTRQKGMLKPQVNFANVPLYFIHNQGQVHKKALFYAKASRYTLWVTKEGLVFDSSKAEDTAKTKTQNKNIREPEFETVPVKYERDVSRLMFLGANKNPKVEAIDPNELKVNYFIGNDKSKWRGGVPTSGAVLYKELFKNIDLKVYGIEKEIEYDWIVKPGGDPAKIRMAYQDVKATRINKNGDLVITTGFGDLVHKKPVSYQWQESNGGKEKKKVPVTASFKKLGNNSYGFTLGPYDKTLPLIIDPVVLAYSTFLGGSKYDFGSSIAVDNDGHAYVTGTTYSPDFPTLNDYRGYQADADIYVTRLDTNATGSAALLYSTYLGGTNEDRGQSIAVAGKDIVYIAGYTKSMNYPLRNQYQTHQGNYDALVTKLDTTKAGVASFLYSTYLGGGDYDTGYGIAVDSNGNAYVTGRTDSTNFPIYNQYQGVQSSADVFVTRLDTNLSGAAALKYSTYLGGNYVDIGKHIVTDNNGRIYITGNTRSTDFPTLNHYQKYRGDGDAFITGLDTNQAGDGSLIYSTCLGGVGFDYGLGISLDDSDYIYVTGFTKSTDFPTLNQYQDFQGGKDVFVSKIDPAQAGSSCLLYSTYMGGTGDIDEGLGIATDSLGNAFVTGRTNSPDFPTFDQYQGYQGSNDAFILCIDTYESGFSSLVYSTYLGGSGLDDGFGIAVDSQGYAYVTGYTTKSDFPTHNRYQGFQGWYDSFVTRVRVLPVASVITRSAYYITETTAQGGGIVMAEGGYAVTARGICWSTGANPTISDHYTTDGSGVGLFNSSMTGLIPATTYYVRAYATNEPGTAYGNEISFTTSTTAPSITTNAITNISTNAAQGGGNITADGGSAVTARGVCWGTATAPTVAGNHTVDGSGTGAFTSSMTGLVPATTYYVRAYATNAAGTAYGNEVSFNTVAAVPVVKTIGVSNITFSEALARGKVTGDGGAAVNNRGICVATHSRPDLGNSMVIGAGSGLGEFSCQLDNLAPATTYYVRAFAKNAAGTGYGRIMSFKTLELPKPMISGKVTAWGTGVAGVVIQFSNNGGQTLTDQMGNYSHIVPYNWTGTATPVKEGYYFQPVSRSYENITGNQVSQNYEAYNIVLSIQATKKKESAWLVNKLYGEIILNVINPGNIAVDKYIIYRRTGDGSFQALAEIPGNQIQSSYTYIDKFLEEKISYTYKFTALAPDGTILATSPEQTI